MISSCDTIRQGISLLSGAAGFGLLLWALVTGPGLVSAVASTLG